MRIVKVANYSKPNPPSLDVVLARPLFAHLATMCRDGPRDSPVWFLWEDESLWLIGNAYDSFPKRIEADRRCAIGIVDFDVRTGRVHHVGLRGTATVEDWNPDRCRRLLSNYLGADETMWDPRFVATVTDYQNQWIRFTLKTVVVRDQSYDITK
jgi:hypothetical protein